MTYRDSEKETIAKVVENLPPPERAELYKALRYELNGKRLTQYQPSTLELLEFALEDQRELNLSDAARTLEKMIPGELRIYDRYDNSRFPRLKYSTAKMELIIPSVERTEVKLDHYSALLKKAAKVCQKYQIKADDPDENIVLSRLNKFITDYLNQEIRMIKSSLESKAIYLLNEGGDIVSWEVTTKVHTIPKVFANYQAVTRKIGCEWDQKREKRIVKRSKAELQRCVDGVIEFIIAEHAKSDSNVRKSSLTDSLEVFRKLSFDYKLNWNAPILD